MLSITKDEATMRNCANYGSVTHSGVTSNFAYIGGIVGYSSGSSSSVIIYIQNCLNYGTVIHSGTTTNSLSIGGILGHVWRGTNNIENCMSGGKIISNKQGNIGSIVGSAVSDTTITQCSWIHIQFCYS